MKRAAALLIVVALCVPAFALEVEWKGVVPAESFTIDLKLKAYRATVERDLRKLAQTLLAEDGYFWPEFLLTGDTLRISAGPQGRLGDVEVRGMPEDAAAASRTFQDATGGRADPSALKEGVESVVHYLVSAGFPFAQVQLFELEVRSAPHVNVALIAHPGNRVYSGDLLTGTTRTRSEVFTRESGWARGRLLTDMLITDTRTGLATLPFVSHADSAKLVSVTADTAALFVRVHEAAGVRIGGLAGWVPATGSEQEGYWGGEFDLELQSPFGDGRTVSLNASRRDPQSRRTHFTYWEPWPWGAPVRMGLSLGQDDFGTDFIETTARARVQLARVSPRWEMHLGAARVTVEEDPSPETFSGERVEAGVSVADSSFGSSYRFAIRWSRQRLDPRDSVSPPQNSIQYTRAEFGVSRLVPLGGAFSIRAQSNGAGSLSRSDFVPPNLLHRVGGLHTLRGYREEEFLVRDYLRVGWELHVGSSAQSLFLFSEAAWLNFTSGEPRIFGSAGVGLRLGTPLQLLMAVPSEGGLSASKIHIGLSTVR